MRMELRRPITKQAKDLVKPAFLRWMDLASNRMFNNGSPMTHMIMKIQLMESRTRVESFCCSAMPCCNVVISHMGQNHREIDCNKIQTELTINNNIDIMG